MRLSDLHNRAWIDADIAVRNVIDELVKMATEAACERGIDPDEYEFRVSVNQNENEGRDIFTLSGQWVKR